MLIPEVVGSFLLFLFGLQLGCAPDFADFYRGGEPLALESQIHPTDAYDWSELGFEASDREALARALGLGWRAKSSPVVWLGLKEIIRELNPIKLRKELRRHRRSHPVLKNKLHHNHWAEFAEAIGVLASAVNLDLIELDLQFALSRVRSYFRSLRTKKIPQPAINDFFLAAQLVRDGFEVVGVQHEFKHKKNKAQNIEVDVLVRFSDGTYWIIELKPHLGRQKLNSKLQKLEYIKNNGLPPDLVVSKASIFAVSPSTDRAKSRTEASIEKLQEDFPPPFYEFGVVDI